MSDQAADLVVVGASRLVTCSPGVGDGPLGVIEEGALAATGGRITWLGREADLAASVAIGASTVELDADGGAVLPGLVDCHTHLVFAGDRSEEFAARMRGEPYKAGGVNETVRATRAATADELAALAQARADRFIKFGVTTIEAKSGYGLTPEHERRLLEVAARLDHPIEIVRTFLGAHVVPEDYEDDRDGYVKLVAEGMIPSLEGLAEFVDVWIDDGAFSAKEGEIILRAARAAGYSVKVHAEQLSHSGGASLAASFAAVSADHLEFATEADAKALAASKTVGVLLPGASLMTRGPLVPARMLIDQGVRVAVSTDFNPGTSYSENLPLAASLACGMLGMTVEETILGVTRNAAAALARERTHGHLDKNAQADLIVLGSAHEADLVRHYGAAPVAAVVKDGRVVVS